MVLDVKKYGDPVLRRKTSLVPREMLEDPEFQKFLDDLVETMQVEDGVGLAAPQVGDSRRVCVAVDGDEVYVLINPKIRGRSVRLATDTEGCLSLPGLQADVPRPAKVIVKAQNRRGETIELRARGLFARILQHEIDHLDGVLYVDRADLSTLVWLRKVAEDKVEKEPTTLDEVKRAYRQKYHAEKPVEELVFDPIQETEQVVA
jgi:peptide deformylase